MRAAGRLWRTVRHLSAEQWLYRFRRRGRLAFARRLPRFARARLERAAAAMPLPDPGRDRIAAVARTVLALQTAVHGETYRGARRGRFRLLNRDFDFGAIEDIAWRGDFHEGANPLRRMVLAYMGYAVPLLAGGAREDLDAVARILRSLEAGNPWSAPGALRDVWNPYTASHRLLNLLSGLALYRRAGGAPDPTPEGEILAHVRLCAALVLRDPERDIQFNHLMKNLVALSAFAAACDTVPAPLRSLETGVPRSLRQNVLADGGHAERSPMYHALALLDVRALIASGLFAESWQPALEETRARMETALAAMSLGDGEIALFNDAWLGEAPPARDLVAIPESGTQRLKDTGYVRLAGGGDVVVFDCGPCGPDANPGHAHADFLSVETTVAGFRFLVDTGVPTYTAGHARDASRAAGAHNGPRIVGAEPIEVWASFRVGRRGRAETLDPSAFAGLAPLSAAGRQDGYAPFGVEVRRFVGLWPGRGLLVADLWRGGDPSRAATGFLVPAGWAITERGSFLQGQAEVTLAALAGTLSVPAAAPVWRRFDVEEAAHRIELAPEIRDGDARAAVLFCWSEEVPHADGAMLDDLFARLAAAEPATGD